MHNRSSIGGCDTGLVDSRFENWQHSMVPASVYVMLFLVSSRVYRQRSPSFVLYPRMELCVKKGDAKLVTINDFARKKSITQSKPTRTSLYYGSLQTLA